MLIKLVLGGDIYRNNVAPGVYPKWSKMHLRIWCIGRMERVALRSMALYRSPPLLAFALRQLGATVGDNLQCAPDAYLSGPLDLISIENDVAIQTGAYIQATRWSGQGFHIGPIRIESDSKIGMRAAVADSVTIGRGAWIAPFTPVLSDVGAQEIWEGAPARFTGRCTQLKRTADFCRYARPIWLLETVNSPFVRLFVLLPQPASHRRHRVARPRLHTGRRRRAFKRLFQRDATGRNRLGADGICDHHGMDQHRGDLAAQLPVHPLHCRVAGTLPLARAQGRAPDLPNGRPERHTAAMDLDDYRAISARARWHALRKIRRVRVRRDVQSRPGAGQRRTPKCSGRMAPFTNMLDYGAEHYKLRQLDMPAEFLLRQQLRGGVRAVSRQLPPGCLHAEQRYTVPAADAVAAWQARSTVAGNPPMKLASASSWGEKKRL